ncbi:MAG: hypothetical protein U5L11_09680 [Arhodomonas sp.]|nr:hypothetical protein [Arhodomonas sp.]
MTSNQALQRVRRLLDAAQGRAYRQSGPPGHGPAAAVLRRGHQGQRLPAGRRQALSGDRAFRCGHGHR